MKINLEAFNLELLQKSLLSEEEKKVLLRLWNDEYPIIISHSSLQSFNHYLDSLENVTHYLLTDLSYNIIKGGLLHFIEMVFVGLLLYDLRLFRKKELDV